MNTAKNDFYLKKESVIFLKFYVEILNFTETVTNIAIWKSFIGNASWKNTTVF